MGLSSAGYLGGKLARKPGPVIDQVTVVRAIAAEVVLRIIGTQLSRDAGFKVSGDVGSKVDDKDVKLSAAQGADPRPTVVVGEDDFRVSSFAKVLELTISDPPNDWLPDALQKKLNLTITNPDGQMAIWPFEPKLPTSPPS